MTQEEARELFDYDASSGELRWRASGRVIGTANKAGYLVVQVRKHRKLFYVHRLIWLWVYGEWPTMIDHANMDRADNRLANLRLATKSGNGANTKVRARVGLKGVWRHGPGWAASIRKDNVTRHLGTFPSPELAHAAYCQAAALMHGRFARDA